MRDNLKAVLEAGAKARPFWICGLCVIEEHDTVALVAETLKKISDKHGIPIVFKASFDKANRTSFESFRGRGLDEGLKELSWVKREIGLPILTDVHETSQVPVIAEVADIIQIPAFLCRQTDLIRVACESGLPVNVKKGQFLSPFDVRNIVSKLEHFGAKGYWLTERGTSFGYQRLVVDFSAFPEIESSGAHLILDVTHSVQLPGAQKNSSGGVRQAIPYLARAGAAAGVYGLFAETHPVPEQAKSDAANAWPLRKLESLILDVKRIAETAHGN